MNSLFDTAPSPGLAQPARTLARRTDPETSKQAAQEAVQRGTVNKQAQLAAQAVKRRPGCTSAELAAQTTGLDHWQYTRRLPDAEKAGLIQRGDARKCEIKGRKMLTWWPVSS